MMLDDPEGYYARRALFENADPEGMGPEYYMFAVHKAECWMNEAERIAGDNPMTFDMVKQAYRIACKTHRGASGGTKSITMGIVYKYWAHQEVLTNEGDSAGDDLWRAAYGTNKR